jgi:hypothetical protein
MADLSKYGVRGNPFHRPNFDQSPILHHTIKTSTDFSVSAGDCDHRHILPSRFSFDFEGQLRFSPPSVFLPDLRVFCTASFTVNVTNTENGRLLIQDVEGYSRDVYFGWSEEIVLEHGETCSLRVYVCPSRKGSFSSLIAFRVRGFVPYSIQWFADSSPGDTFPPPVFYRMKRSHIDVQNRLPVFFESHRDDSLVLIYDTRLFLSHRFTRARNSVLCLRLADLKGGKYWTFVHVVGPAETRTYPLCLSISRFPIQSRASRACLRLATSPSDVSDAKIAIVNLTRGSYRIERPGFFGDSPPNLGWELVPG